MTPRQKELVQMSFTQVAPIAETAAALFYDRLFTLDPALRPMFKGELAEQGRKLMQMLAVAVNGLERLDSLQPALRALGQRHTHYGVRERDYETVGAALLWTLERGLGAAFTPEVREAWGAAYQLLTASMRTVALAA